MVLESEDGLDWKISNQGEGEDANGLPISFMHETVVMNNRLWVIGGQNEQGKPKNV